MAYGYKTAFLSAANPARHARIAPCYGGAAMNPMLAMMMFWAVAAKDAKSGWNLHSKTIASAKSADTSGSAPINAPKDAP